MDTKDFNQTASVPRYGYQLSPVHPRAFQIVRYGEKDPAPVGDYMVLDREEDLTLAEKKVMNLVSLLNGRDKLIQLGEETKARQLFHLINDGTNGEKVKVMFYHYKGGGCSEENALFTFEGDADVVWH